MDIAAPAVVALPVHLAGHGGPGVREAAPVPIGDCDWRSPGSRRSELVVDDLRFHPSVAAGRLKLPCATTPTEDDAGRPAPKRARQKLSEATKARWAADSRRFAPWHYTEEAMMTDKAGKLHVVPAPVRERLHHIPAGVH